MEGGCAGLKALLTWLACDFAGTLAIGIAFSGEAGTVFLLQSQSTWASLNRVPQTKGFNNRSVLSHRCGGPKSKIKVGFW